MNGDDANPNNDDNLYLLNTSTTSWTTAKVAGAKPSGRYGHTLNMLGPKVLVFGGQVEGFFFNDLVAFDLNTLNHANPRWELISPVEGSEPPPARTNHIAITHTDKLYIFGGTNGVDWFNDIWRFDPLTRVWTMLKCSGFVPQPREGHSASLVGDVIYIFGGRDVDGNDLGDLSAFKISTSRWFTFQNMGPGPSPRSGHALCTVGKRIYVVGGEGASSRGDEQMAYILDTTKVRYPAEARPNTEAALDSPTPRTADSKVQSIRSVSGQSTTSTSRLPSRPRDPRAVDRRVSQNGDRPTQLRQPSTRPGVFTTVPRSTSLDSMAPEPNERLNRVKSLEEMKDTRRQLVTPLAMYEDKTIPTSVNSSENAVKIAWLTAELDMARKAGYTSVKDVSMPEHELTPALLTIRQEINSMQERLNESKSEAAEKVKAALVERDVALRECAYEKARNEAFVSNNPEMLQIVESQRNTELELKLAESAARQADLQREASRQPVAVPTNDLAHSKAMAEAQEKHAALVADHTKLQSLLSELQTSTIEHKTRAASLESTLAARSIDDSKLRDLEARHTTGLAALEAAHSSINMSAARLSSAENELRTERERSSNLQSQLDQLNLALQSQKQQLDRHVTDKSILESNLQQANAEAESARNVMTAGLQQLVNHSRSLGPHDPAMHQAELEQVRGELQQTRDLHAQAQQLLTEHTSKLSAAHEQIRSLEEAHSKHAKSTVDLQEQILSHQTNYSKLEDTHRELINSHSSKQVELEESGIRYAALEQIINSRPSRRDSFDKRRSRAAQSPNGRSSQTPDASRLKELEQKLQESAALQRDMQQSHQQATREIEALSNRHRAAEQRARELEMSTGGSDLQSAQARAAEAEQQLTESTANFKERLGQLEADYQSAVHYVKGTEKMLRRMKEELGKYKTANAKLQTQLELAASDPATTDLEQQLAALTLEKHSMQRDLERLQSNGDNPLQAQVERLEYERQEMERRMNESDAKVKLLLDQFESSVDTYRRQSQIMSSPEERVAHDSPTDLPAPSLGMQHRTSSALDLLATELDQLRSRWEAAQPRSSVYRISEDSSNSTNNLVPLGRPVISRGSSHTDTAIDTLRNKRSRGLKSPKDS